MLHRSPVRLAQIRMCATTLLTVPSASGLCDLCVRVATRATAVTVTATAITRDVVTAVTAQGHLEHDPAG